MLYKSANRSTTAAFGSGAAVGTLGGLIGLGRAEFRLPLLIGLFGFQGLEAVILNKATSYAWSLLRCSSGPRPSVVEVGAAATVFHPRRWSPSSERDGVRPDSQWRRRSHR